MKATLHFSNEYACPKGATRKQVKPADGYSYVTEKRFTEFCMKLPLGLYFVTGAFNAPQIVNRTRGKFTYRDASPIHNTAPPPVEIEVSNA